jgi:hypothetical protein
MCYYNIAVVYNLRQSRRDILLALIHDVYVCTWRQGTFWLTPVEYTMLLWDVDTPDSGVVKPNQVRGRPTKDREPRNSSPSY